ncbi:serine/arginine repetitive matrix protein 1 [Aplysia californica]|uniref:Serine/arginine repetitive matrix protein 1 n=1 Tax=Aplysia californica TaxID=6500 RepID=A0ABM0K8H3_APLCA|nr:serine/arginine repetitive matrix protein 1 [Aplysia californica]
MSEISEWKKSASYLPPSGCPLYPRRLTPTRSPPRNPKSPKSTKHRGSRRRSVSRSPSKTKRRQSPSPAKVVNNTDDIEELPSRIVEQHGVPWQNPPEPVADSPPKHDEKPVKASTDSFEINEAATIPKSTTPLEVKEEATTVEEKRKRSPQPYFRRRSGSPSSRLRGKKPPSPLSEPKLNTSTPPKATPDKAPKKSDGAASERFSRVSPPNVRERSWSRKATTPVRYVSTSIPQGNSWLGFNESANNVTEVGPVSVSPPTAKTSDSNYSAQSSRPSVGSSSLSRERQETERREDPKSWGDLLESALIL